MDLLFDPGALYEEHSAKAQEYRRLLGECETAAEASARGQRQAGALPTPPSARQDLSGEVPRPPWHVETWELEVHRSQRIGRGGFGEVFHGRWEGTLVAVKEVKDSSPTDGDVVDFILEIALLSQLNHPNIVRFWRGCAEVRAGSRSLLMVTEFVRKGGLSRLLHGHGGPPLPEPLSIGQALSLGLDVARGCQYLHGQRVLHLDLKSPNVLVSPSWTAKLCDFGLAKIRGEGASVVMSTLQGVSPIWAPPEFFDDQAGGLTEKADVYSFAIVLFEVLARQVPFQEVSAAQLPALKVAGRLPQIPASVPEDCQALVRQCCSARLAARPSMSGVVARLREIVQAHGVRLADVRPPASLLSLDCGAGDGAEAEQRLREQEASAAQHLAELDAVRAKVRTELAELQRRLEQVRRRGREGDADLDVGGGDEGEDGWCDAFVQEVGGTKFRCAICSKLFRGPEFVRRHVVMKHHGEAKRMADDAYFDCDISREDSLPVQRSQRSAAAPGSPTNRRDIASGVVEGCFCQALQNAAESGDDEELLSLLQSRASPGQQDDSGANPVALAARAGHLQAVEALLAAAPAHGITAAELVGKTTGAGLTALHAAAGEGHCQVLATLLRLRVGVEPLSAQGKTPLLLAGENGHAEACALLIEHRASAEKQTPEGETLLHAAARFGDADLIRRVVEWRASLLAQDRDGWTPLHEAAHWGASAAEALCQARADVHGRSRDGETALHVALGGYEQLAACEVLLRFRADPRAPDTDGESPLHVAARHGAGALCGALLAARADASAIDRSGRTPLDLAKSDEARSALDGL